MTLSHNTKSPSGINQIHQRKIYFKHGSLVIHQVSITRLISYRISYCNIKQKHHHVTRLEQQNDIDSRRR